MWDRLNQEIIKVQQEIKINEKKSNNIKENFTCIAILSTIIVFTCCFAVLNFDIQPKNPLYLIGFCIVMIFAIVSFGHCTFIELLLYPLHYILPGKDKRNTKVKEFLMSYYQKEDMDKYTFFDQEKFKNFSKENIKEWVDQYIGTETSIHNLINTRVLGSKYLNMGIVYWSQLIPLSKLDVNQKRTILQSCQVVDNEACLYDLYLNFDLEKVFNYYSATEIVRLFTSPYKLEEYVEVLKLAGDYELSFPVKKNVRELQDWIWNIKILKDEKMFTFKRDKPWIEKMESGTELGIVKHIDNQLEFEQWGEYLSNCLRNPKQHYHSRVRYGDSHLFAVWRFNRPYMLIELTKHGAFMEAKKRANAVLSHDELMAVMTYIKKCVK